MTERSLDQISEALERRYPGAVMFLRAIRLQRPPHGLSVFTRGIARH